MKILIDPTIREHYKNQIEISVDLKLINFLHFVYGEKIKIEIFNKKIINKPNLIVMLGGNNIPRCTKSISDKTRNKRSNHIYNYAIKNKVPLIGICYGAQFIGFKNKFLFKKKRVIGSHNIKLSKEIEYFKEKSLKVNSFKSIIITKTNNYFKNIYLAEDGSVECFSSKNPKILGLMWHPERYLKYKSIDKKIFKRIL
tara:strand:- start:398 stop:991 length:594 start_codon:yes stop_codon:yes gene_type:complete